MDACPETSSCRETSSCLETSSCRETSSDGVQPGFSSPDPNRFLDVGNEDFAVADAAGLGRAPDGIDGFLYQIVGNHNFDFPLVQKIAVIFLTPLNFPL